MATNKDILLKDKNNNSLYPLAHQDYNQHILDEFYFGTNGTLSANTDLNTIIKVGTYWLKSNTQYISCPKSWVVPNSNTRGILIVYKSNYNLNTVLIQKIIQIVGSNVITYHRYLNSNNDWDEWIDSSETTNGNIYTTLPRDTDLNNVYKPGAYWLYSSYPYVNDPFGGATTASSYGMLFVLRSNTESAAEKRVIQQVIRIYDGKLNIYYRYHSSNYPSWDDGWTSWIEASGSGGGGTGAVDSVSAGAELSVGTTTGNVTVSHKIQTGLQNQTTKAIYPIAFNKYGHITSADTAVTIPTKLTDLTNDGNFVQDSSYVHTYNASLSFYKNSSLVRTFTANASTSKSLTFTTTNIGSANLLDKTFVDSVSLTGGSVPTKKSQTVITGGTTSTVTVPLLNKVIGSVSFNDVIIGGSTTSFYPAIDQTVITSATGAYATYSSGILTIFNGNFTSNNNVSTSAINVYTGLISGVAGSATEDSVAKISHSVYTSLSSSDISIIDSVGTLPQLSHTTANISEAISITNTTVLSDVLSNVS